MKDDVGGLPSALTPSESKLFIGRFLRRQGQYGTVAVIGNVRSGKVELIEDSKRLFPKNGLVETHGLISQAGLVPGDWIEFEVGRNNRPRAPEYKVAHHRRLPRYAVLPELPIAGYRALLTREGWRGDRHPGLWALRISTDKIIIVPLAPGKDGALRIPRHAAHEVSWYDFNEALVARLQGDGVPEDILVANPGSKSGTYDWSDEADHIARVVKSLSDAKDSRVDDIITWLDLHHEQGTGRITAGQDGSDFALAAVRSGELAQRLRADRALMQTYLEAAIKDKDVHAAVAQYAREGHVEERTRLVAELERELASEKIRRTSALAIEFEQFRADAIDRVEREIVEINNKNKSQIELRMRNAESEIATKVKSLNDDLASQQKQFDREKLELQNQMAAHSSAKQASIKNLEELRMKIEEADLRLVAVSADIDRLLSVKEKLEVPHIGLATETTPRSSRGALCAFPQRPMAPVADKGHTIEQLGLLTPKGKEMLRRLMVILLSGEMPVLFGNQANDFIWLAGMIMCGGRFGAIEADPTLISVDDLWSRPGSGISTMLAVASEEVAQERGAVLVAVRGIERSGARFWVPGLSDGLRNGNFPRGLFVCCLVSDRDHEEIAALPKDLPWIDTAGVFDENACAGAPSFFSSPNLAPSVIDPGLAATDLSKSNGIVFDLGFKPSLGQAIRFSRMFAEAKILTRDEKEAQRIVLDVVRSMQGK